MTPSNRLNRDIRHTHQQLTDSAKVRKSWGVFEQWYVGQRETIDKQRSKALRDLERKAYSKKEKDSRKSILNQEHDIQLRDIARKEWDRRLTESGFCADQWVDMTPQEGYKIERMLAGPDAHLTEKEYVAQWPMAASSSVNSSPPTQARIQPTVPTTQSIFSPPISASSSLQSNSYEYFNPSACGDADDEREAGSSMPIMGSNGYVTSDEDGDIDTTAYIDWKGDDWQSASPPLRHANIATLDAKSTLSKPPIVTKKATIQPPPAMARQSTSSSAATSSSRHSPPSFASSIAASSAKHSPPSFAAPKPQLARRDEELMLMNLEKERQEEALRKEEAERRSHQQWLIAQPQPSPLAPSPAAILENSAPLCRISSNESDHRVPAYIGPHHQTDTFDSELEEEEFERFKIRVREDKICEFHREASELDVHLARDIHNHRKTWGLSPDQEAQKIAEHEAAMRQLRQQKEVERKQIVSQERKRIRAELELKKRAIEPARRGSQPSTSVVPSVSSHPVSTPSAPVAATSRQSRRVATTAASRIRQEAAANTPKPSQRAPVKEVPPTTKPSALASDGLPADIAQRFAETQRLAQVAHSDNALDADIALRFQQSQRRAQSSMSREPSEGPHLGAFIDAKGKGKLRSASPPSDTSAYSRSSSRMTSAMGWNSSPSAFTDRSGWSSGTESSSGGPRALHRSSSSSVTVEEVEDDDYSPWMNTHARFEAPQPQRMTTGTPASSIQMLQSQSESPFMYMEMADNGASPIDYASNDVVAVSSFQYDEEEAPVPNPPGGWDFSDASTHMDTPDFWDSLLASGDAPSRPLPPSTRGPSVLPRDSFGGEMWTPASLNSSSNFSFDDDVRSASAHNSFNAPTPSAFSTRHAPSAPAASVKKAVPVPTQPLAPKAMPLSPVAQTPKSSFMSPPPPAAAAQVAAPPPTATKNAKKGKGGKRR
ncbi:hypothetical protein BDV98DRAFT_583185 [Pterulicium gracile]|uniref:Uncharacterized protein n=1 Tax=Pterulicium gracile TaxID=1884261 RepID=A0A5C3QFD6_9AGAR|nr:hypothetical protein BDV98DRAFT_583185 [Pterula gracilis]